MEKSSETLGSLPVSIDPSSKPESPKPIEQIIQKIDDEPSV